MPFEQNYIPRVQPFLFHETAPALGQYVALAAVPIRVSKPPRLARLVLEAQQQPFLTSRVVAAAEGKIFLGVLLWDDEAVELADITRGQWLLEQGLFGYYFLVFLLFGDVGVVFPLILNDSRFILFFVVQVEAESS